MALFEFLGKKKEHEEAMPPLGPPAPDQLQRPFPPTPAMPKITSPGTAPSEAPVQKVLDFRSQGLNDDEIISELQMQGYSLVQIDSALRQAAASAAVKGPAPISGQLSQPMPSEKDFEKLAESIIEEKWKQAEERFEKEREWKEKTEIRMATIEKSVTDTKETLESLNRAIVGKINEYDKSLLSVGTEMKAMEQVFKQILPTLTSNVTELSRVAKEFKRKKPTIKMPGK